MFYNTVFFTSMYMSFFSAVLFMRLTQFGGTGGYMETSSQAEIY